MKKTMIACLLGATIVLAACGSENEVIVSTSLGDITQGEFYESAKEIAGTALLEQVVINKVLEEKYEVTDEEVDEEYEYYEEMYGDSFADLLTQNGYTEESFRNSLYFQLLQDKASEDVDITDEEVEKYYEQGKYELNARHILVDTEEEANEVLEKLNAGEDFAKLATEYSTDSSTAENGGELDWFTVGEMTSEFNDAAYALEVDEISEPVESDYGYHIIQLTDKKEVEDYASLEDQKDDITQKLKEQKAAATDWEEVEARLLKEYDVVIKDDSLKGAFSDTLEE